MRAPSAVTSMILVLGLASAAGCGRTPDPPVSPAQTPPTAAPVPSGSDVPATATESQAPSGVLLAYVWDCDDGTSITMENLLAENAISLGLPDGPRRLPQVVAASGVKYDDGTLSFWTKGDTAMLERANGPVVNCAESRAKSLVADARARGVAFRGTGNEPGWVLEIFPADRLVFVTNYGQDRHEFDGVSVTGEPGPGAEYRAARDGRSIVARLKLEPCVDDMAGTPFDYSLVLEFDGRTFRGCAASTR